MKVFGRDIIREIARKLDLDPVEIVSRSQRQHLHEARLEIIYRLRDLKFTQSQIGRLLNRSDGTIGHHLNPKRRELSNARARVAMRLKRRAEQEARQVKIMTGREIAESLCRSSGFQPNEVFGGGRRSKEVSRVRLLIIQRLRNDYSTRQIAEYLGMDHSSVLYHMLPPSKKHTTKQRSIRNYRLRQRDNAVFMSERDNAA